MKTERYHTIGARRNPAGIVVIESDNGRESLALVPEEQERVHEATNADMTFTRLDEGIFDKVLAFAKRHLQVEANEVKHWTTAALREEWRKEDPDDVETGGDGASGQCVDW